MRPTDHHSRAFAAGAPACLRKRADGKPLGLHWEKPARGQGCPWDKHLGNCGHPQRARCRCQGRERGRPFTQHLLRAGGLFSVLLFIDIHNNPGGAGVRQRGCAVHRRSVPPLTQRELVARSSCPAEGLLFPDFLHLGGAPTEPWPVCGMCAEALNAGPPETPHFILYLLSLLPPAPGC